jgi:hypothetical protein
MGGAINAEWEAAASMGLGSPIPADVAEALQAKEYSEFRNLKKAIWRSMSRHPEVIAEMNAKILI